MRGLVRGRAVAVLAVDAERAGVAAWLGLSNQAPGAHVLVHVDSHARRRRRVPTVAQGRESTERLLAHVGSLGTTLDQALGSINVHWSGCCRPSGVCGLHANLRIQGVTDEAPDFGCVDSSGLNDGGASRPCGPPTDGGTDGGARD